MPLQHVNWAANQRVELLDMQAMGDLGLANLTLLARAFLTPGVTSRVVRGGRVSATDPASKNVLVGALAAVNPSGAIIILESEATKAIADNASGNDRIDLVSVSVALVDDEEAERKFWNPSTETSFDSDTDTRSTATVTVTVTQGVPSASPGPPATPAGHVALAQVLVVDGMTSITDDDITMLEPSFVTPVKYRQWQWEADLGTTGTTETLPYVTPENLLTLNVPAGQVAIVHAQVGIFFTITGAAQPGGFLVDLEAFDGASSETIGRCEHMTALELPAWPRTMTVLGILPGGGGEIGIRLRIARFTLGAQPEVRLVDDWVLVVDTIQVVNRIVAVTL
jgi:hypothetical protein